jgi:hypothetical protein
MAGEWRFSSHLVKKKAGTVFCGKKSEHFYGGNRNQNIKKMAGKHFPIGIGKQIGKIGPKKDWNTESGGIPAEFPTKTCYVVSVCPSAQVIRPFRSGNL